MSIQEFHSQLTRDDQPDPVIAALGRLTQVEDSQFAAQIPSAEWAWNGSAS
jgi:hypothetical protein